MSRRTERIAEQLRSEIARVLREEANDPRTRLVTLTRVDVATGLEQCPGFLERARHSRRGLPPRIRSTPSKAPHPSCAGTLPSRSPSDAYPRCVFATTHRSFSEIRHFPCCDHSLIQMKRRRATEKPGHRGFPARRQVAGLDVARRRRCRAALARDPTGRTPGHTRSARDRGFAPRDSSGHEARSVHHGRPQDPTSARSNSGSKPTPWTPRVRCSAGMGARFPKSARSKKALVSFQGEIEQVPPMYSAVKQSGVPLHRLAREGKARRARSQEGADRSN